MGKYKLKEPSLDIKKLYHHIIKNYLVVWGEKINLGISKNSTTLEKKSLMDGKWSNTEIKLPKQIPSFPVSNSH